MRRSSRQGAALVIALITVVLVCALAATGGARAYGLRAARLRDERRERLRAAVWNATWTQLAEAAATPGRAPAAVLREAPDGVKTSVTVQPVGDARRGEPVRYAVAVCAEIGPARRESWALAQREQDGAFRIPVWVER